ncbi:MAG: M6 family metalloprotease domain-containing protein [candidate division Zixibacteria bacterium]|nr:M6 family metalloprotease domain-containing protein [candidate division Zixibacteria bacterium]
MIRTKMDIMSGMLRTSLIILIAGLLCSSNAISSPPHPSLLEARGAAKAAGQSLSPLPNLADMHARGINMPEDCFGLKKDGRNALLGATAATPFRILAIVVDFSDHVTQTGASFFDTLVFGPGTGTVDDYFDEISYGTIDLVSVNLPSSMGWERAPQTYAYYVNGSYGTGPWPNNSQKLVEDMVDAVDPVVDFSNYDNDGDGYVDILLVIHSGTGAEYSGNANDMWSHKWGINRRLTGEGVYVSAFTVQPEFWASSGDMTCGVYSHELLHGFGLPDLYDIDGSSQGIGRWGIMSSGSWNGTLGSSPAHPCAWSRCELGFTTAINVTANTVGQSISSVNNGGDIYRLWTSGDASSEYFLVENRRQVGYDAGLPSEGLLIWHIDDGKITNEQEWWPGETNTTHFLVALEQADGLYELEHNSGYGDNADCWPGSLNRTDFNGTTGPNSDGYTSGGSFVAVENISAAGETMTADLLVGIAASVVDNDITLPTTFSLEQNYPNPFNPNTSIAFDLSEGSAVKLEVFNILGKQVRVLIDGYVAPGTTTIVWDATDQSGAKVASGTYFYRLTVDNTEQTKKMVLLK